MIRELFEFALVQTDPNFGNFLYDAESRRIVLLDFGATRAVPPALIAGYRQLARATLADDRTGMRQGAIALGYIGSDEPPAQVERLLDLIALSGEVISSDGPYDFGHSTLFERVFARGRDMFNDQMFNHMPASSCSAAACVLRSICGRCSSPTCSTPAPTASAPGHASQTAQNAPRRLISWLPRQSSERINT